MRALIPSRPRAAVALVTALVVGGLVWFGAERDAQARVSAGFDGNIFELSADIALRQGFRTVP